MTSHQFSANKYAAKYDFKRALKSTIVPAILTFLLSLYYFVVSPLTVFINYLDVKKLFDLTNLRKNIALCLTNQSYLSAGSGESVGILFIILGVLFAIFAFGFIMKKRDVNVFFSSSIDRRTMFKNRTLACMLIMAAALLIPIIADIAMNIYFFANAGYVIKYGLLIFAECYVYTLTGFSLMLIAMSYCTTIVESIFFTGAVAFAPTAVAFTLHSLGSAFLRGYNYAAFPRIYGYYSFQQPSLLHYTSIINPFILGKAYGASYSVGNNLINFGFHVTKTSDYNDYLGGYGSFIDYENASFDYILPVIVWAILCVCFIFIARQLFIKIKAENSGVHGTRPIATNFFAVEYIILLFASGVSLYSPDLATSKKTSVLIAGAVAMFIWYFIIIAISKRTIKRKLKELIVPVTTIGITFIFTFILMNGGLGFSTYVPDPEDVSKAIITVSDTNFTLEEIPNAPDSEFYGSIYTAPYADDALAVFTDAEDLKALTEINAKLTETTDNMTGNGVFVYYELKNGRIVSRYYETTDYDAQYSVLSLRDSKAAHEYLTHLLTGDPKDQPLTNLLKNSSIDVNAVLSYEVETDLPNVFQKGRVWVLDSNDMMTYKSIKNTPQFREALLKDLLSQTYEERFRPTEHAIGGVLFSFTGYNGDDDIGQYYGTYYEAGYYIYPSMTNTIDYLKSTGEYELFAAEPDEIESISIDSVKSIRKKQFGDWDSDSYTTHQFRSQIQAYYNEEDYYEEDYEYYQFGYYSDISDYFKDEKTFTDSKQIKELLDKSKLFYFSDDNDYIIMIKYKKAGYVTRLITANEVPKWAIGQQNA